MPQATNAAIVSIGLVALAGCAGVAAQKPPPQAAAVAPAPTFVSSASVNVQGAGIGGTARTFFCGNDTDTSCTLPVLARYEPASVLDFANTACAIRVRSVVYLGPHVATVTWQLYGGGGPASDPGFAFSADPARLGITIDGGSASYDSVAVAADKMSVTATLKSKVTANAFGYTVNLDWSKTVATQPMNGQCAGLDPLLINRDN